MEVQSLTHKHFDCACFSAHLALKLIVHGAIGGTLFAFATNTYAQTLSAQHALKPLLAPFDETAIRQSRRAWRTHLDATRPQLRFRFYAIKMVLVPPGEFDMGRDDILDDIVGDKLLLDAIPVHRVQITNPFYVSQYLITNVDYRRFVKPHPNYPWDPYKNLETSGYPALVDWLSAVRYCNVLSKYEGFQEYYQVNANGVTIAGGDGFRLLTEAEWEYCCRAGTTTPWYFGNSINFSEANLGHPFPTTQERIFRYGLTPVGSYRSNAFGLFDMHGNSDEWCWDWYSSEYYASSPTVDPPGPDNGTMRVTRGGRALSSLSAFRRSMDPSLGAAFRIARNAVPNQRESRTTINN